MATLFWLIVFLGACFALIYNRVELRLSTAILGAVLVAFTSFSGAGFFWLFILWVLFAGFALLNVETLRRERLSAPILDVLKKLLPRLSETERAALEAGSVWWEGELFSGMPDWRQLTRLPAPKLTEAEQAFLDGPTEELCTLADEWPITHDLQDMPQPVWDFIREKGFFSLIIPEEYGGKGFSPLAISMILAKLASRTGTTSTTVGVPNSLGPAELLLHYGTEEQKQRWLPGLASAEEIPCFALTSIHAGSDATGLVDSGVVCKGEFDGEEIIGIRLNWDKRYITLAPVATVLGLAFKLYDPDHLIGDRDEYGITAALIPTDLPGVEIGNRHLPIGIPFQNGPTRGKDVFVPLDCIIGGKEMAGEGWRMLVELLSAGRGIVLPSNAVGGAMAAVHATGAYARIRRQFKVPIGEFHGIGEALARMTGYTYIMTAASRVTCTALNEGEKPAVPTAILKYHNTEMSRRVANDAMDIHGGKGVMRGPTNYLATAYASLPISITVEGANILTRNLIIFGQGAIRCHPFVLSEMHAAADEDPGSSLEAFDRLIFSHVGYTLSNALRSFVLGLTHGRLSGTPTTGPVRRYYQHINRFSAAFALACDASMFLVGGELKRKEQLSARLGDILSYLYLASMVLKHHQDQGSPADDIPLVEWSCRTLMFKAQQQLDGLLRNLPNRWAVALLRILIFPRGKTYSPPADRLDQQIAAIVTHPTEARSRLCEGIYTTREPGNPLGQLQEALEMADKVAPLEIRLREARKSGQISGGTLAVRITEAREAGILSAAEASELQAFDDAVTTLLTVDDFTPDELGATAPA